VTHDLGVVAALADRIAVMYAGRFVEAGETQALLANPRHPYTAGLLAAVPRLGDRGELATIAGSPPRPGEMFRGCRFAPRCLRSAEPCRAEDPSLAGQSVAGAACHFPLGPGDRP